MLKHLRGHFPSYGTRKIEENLFGVCVTPLHNQFSKPTVPVGREICIKRDGNSNNSQFVRGIARCRLQSRAGSWQALSSQLAQVLFNQQGILLALILCFLSSPPASRETELNSAIFGNFSEFCCSSSRFNFIPVQGLVQIYVSWTSDNRKKPSKAFYLASIFPHPFLSPSLLSIN